MELKTNPLRARERLQAYMKEQARAVYDLLIHLVAEHNIPPACPEANTGGIVIGGWSFGALWMTTLLANVASFPVHGIELGPVVDIRVDHCECIVVDARKRAHERLAGL